MARWLSGNGIEIGALHHPLSVPVGADVRYVDRMPESELREHYKELQDESFAPISIIGNAQDLTNIEDDSVDFVINHLVEHLDNPIRGPEGNGARAPSSGRALPCPAGPARHLRLRTPADHGVAPCRRVPERAGCHPRAHFRDWVERRSRTLAHFGRADEVEERVQTLLEMDCSIHYHLWRPDTFLEFLAAARAETGIGGAGRLRTL